MNLIKCLVIIVIIFSIVNCELTDSEDEAFLDERDASEFVEHVDVDKRFLYTGKEQRREAKEQYEEKCERKLLNAARHKPRWCPELETWPAWNQWRAKDGLLYQNTNGVPGRKPNVKPPPKGPRQPNNMDSNNNDFNRAPYDPNAPFDPYNNQQYPNNQKRPHQPKQPYPYPPY